MASSRPRRQVKQPERFGAYGQASESEEEAPRRQRPAAKRRRAEFQDEEDASGLEGSRAEHVAAADGSSVDDSGSSGAEEPDSEAEAPPPKRQRSGGGGKRKAAAAPSLKPFVPAPPAQPVPPSDFLAALHACPRLMEMFLEKDDGLRSVTLVARDCAALCTALGASGADAAELWRTLAYTAVDGQRYSAVTPVEEALAAVKAAVKADPARWQRVTKSAAMKEFRLTDKDLSGLQFTTRRNPIFWNSAPTKMYARLDCLVAAHKKHGSLQAIQAAAARSLVTADKRKATLAGGEEARREEVEAALEAAGLSARNYQRKKPVKAFVKRGVGTAKGIAAAFKKEIKDTAARAKRQDELLKRVKEEGLTLPWDLSYMAVLDGSSGQSVEEYVAGLKAAQQAKEARAQRDASIRAALQREGLTRFIYNDSVSLHIQTGAPSEAEALAACRQRAQQEQAVVERGQRITAWLAEQHMPRGYGYTVPAARQYERGECSEEAAQQACREQLAADQARDQRRQDVSQLLQAEGHPANYGSLVPELVQYVASGTGTRQELLAAAQAQRTTDQRRTALLAALAAEGMASNLAHAVPAAQAYVSTGEGRQEAAVAACHTQHQLNEQRTARRAEVQALLPAGMEYFTYSYCCPEAGAFVERGEGSAAAAAAAMVAWRAAHPAYGYYDSEGYYDY